MAGASRTGRWWRAGGGAWLVIMASSLGADSPVPDTPRAVVKRGLTGEIHFHHPDIPVRADPDQDLSSPILVRVEPIAGPEDTEYTVRFMGTRAGTYNLSDWLFGPDGRPAPGLEPLPVQVISDLPEGQGTNLYEIADPPVSIRGGYRRLVRWLILGWILVPVWALVRRCLRPRVVTEPPPLKPAPTLADQIRPLAVRAREHTLTVAEQGRLELLLYFFWRERLEPPGSSLPELLPRLRKHAEAGPLLTAVEQWLHQPGGDGGEDPVLDRLLEPYRHAPVIPESELAGSMGERGAV